MMLMITILITYIVELTDKTFFYFINYSHNLVKNVVVNFLFCLNYSKRKWTWNVLRKYLHSRFPNEFKGFLTYITIWRITTTYIMHLSLQTIIVLLFFHYLKFLFLYLKIIVLSKVIWCNFWHSLCKFNYFPWMVKFRSSHPKMFHDYNMFLKISLAGMKLYLKRDSKKVPNAGVFLLLLGHFHKQLFYRTPLVTASDLKFL